MTASRPHLSIRLAAGLLQGLCCGLALALVTRLLADDLPIEAMIPPTPAWLAVTNQVKLVNLAGTDWWGNAVWTLRGTNEDGLPLWHGLIQFPTNCPCGSTVRVTQTNGANLIKIFGNQDLSAFPVVTAVSNMPPNPPVISLTNVVTWQWSTDMVSWSTITQQMVSLTYTGRLKEPYRFFRMGIQ